ncbi:MAG: polymer-forming cytoskeletal protein [Dethiobacter sp.]|jgi:cytoskeletal protein CcmA (bactofilin family)|nr:polymer-forming cytoskeletal protein [Dethiobacter sp.]
MGFSKESGGKFLTLIGKDTAINGALQGSGSLRIDGRVQGEINVAGDLVIGESAVVEATVKGRNIQVAGRIAGNIEALGTLEIHSSGVVQGDVNVKSFQVAVGAVFQGNCSMKKEEPKK